MRQKDREIIRVETQKYVRGLSDPGSCFVRTEEEFLHRIYVQTEGRHGTKMDGYSVDEVVTRLFGQVRTKAKDVGRPYVDDQLDGLFDLLGIQEVQTTYVGFSRASDMCIQFLYSEGSGEAVLTLKDETVEQEPGYTLIHLDVDSDNPVRLNGFYSTHAEHLQGSGQFDGKIGRLGGLGKNEEQEQFVVKGILGDFLMARSYEDVN